MKSSALSLTARLRECLHAEPNLLQEVLEWLFMPVWMLHPHPAFLPYFRYG